MQNVFQHAVLVMVLMWVGLGEAAVDDTAVKPPGEQSQVTHKKINMVVKAKRRTPNPAGWEEYDGAVYTKERGYGWLSDISGKGGDKGGIGYMILPDGTRASPVSIGRLELANWQGVHQENRPLVFRIDLPDGWYQVTCTSVDPDNAPLPLVDQRSIKFRAHDVVLAGPLYGPPLAIEGNRLVEGAGIVEVTEGHLRIVVGDPAYGGWTWSYTGPWSRGWRTWFGRLNLQRYAESWYQKLTRTVDPGFHSLRFNSLEVERVHAPPKQSTVLFRDFFNRDDSPDASTGMMAAARWIRTKLHPIYPDRIGSELSKTSLKLTGPLNGTGVIGLVQQGLSPAKGIVRYSTRVSLFTGEGSRIHAGIQEAGVLLVGNPDGVGEFNSTFVGVAYDSTQEKISGSMKYRVGDGKVGYRSDFTIPDLLLPFKIANGEYEIIVEHDVPNNVLTRIRINNVELSGYLPFLDLKQRIPRGLFGVRAHMNANASGVALEQWYWYYRVEALSS